LFDGVKEEGRLCLNGNRILRETFGPTGEEITGDWKKLQKVILISVQ
jgi:hypothetical protein